MNVQESIGFRDRVSRNNESWRNYYLDDDSIFRIDKLDALW